ncbi:hypothetical protein BvCmsKKP042_01817 [Escherichia coli]|nr:hypothetical protein BvCmsKKP042_01817 [Escherichia coli]
MQHSTQSDSLGWPQFVPPDKPCRPSIHIFKRRQKQCSPFLAGGGGRGAGSAPVSPSATARSAAGVLDRPASARPRSPYRSTRDRFLFPKNFFSPRGGVGGGCLPAPDALYKMPGKIFLFFCGGYVVKSHNRLWEEAHYILLRRRSSSLRHYR